MQNRKLKKKAYYGHTKVKRKVVMVAMAKIEGDIYYDQIDLCDLCAGLASVSILVPTVRKH